MTLVITATTPDGTLTENIYPKRVEIQSQLNEPSSLRMDFDGYWDRYNDETSATNPLQLNSLITVTRNSQVIYNGIVITRTLKEDDNAKSITVECGDRLYALSRYPTGNGSYYDYKKPSPSVVSGTITMLPLELGSRYGYPDPSETDHWMPITTDAYRVVYTELSETIDADDTTIKATADHKRMRSVGLIKIDSEIIYYQGYDLNNDTPGVYVFKGCQRGQLGTSPAGHTATATINQMVAKRIDPYTDQYTISATASSGDVSVYYPLYEDGAFYFPDGQLAATGHTMQYTYIDENDATSDPSFQTTESTIVDILDNIGWDSTGVSLQLVVLPYMSFDGRSLLVTIQSLLTEAEGKAIIRGSYSDDPSVFMWHDHSTDTVKIKIVRQDSNPTYLHNVSSITTSYSLADAYNRWASGIARQNAVSNPEVGDYPYISLSGTYSSSTFNVMYSPDMYTKLNGNWDTVFGGSSESGLSSRFGAISSARRQLLEQLYLPTARTFEFRELPSATPMLGSTYRYKNYIGVCTQLSYKSESNYEYMSLQLVRYTGGGGIV